MMKVFYTEKTHLLWRVSFIAGISNVVLNLIFIPIFGFKAAAYTTFVSLMYMGFSGHFIRAIREDHKENFYPLFWLALIIGSTTLAFFSVEFDFFLKTILSLILFGVISFTVYKFRVFFRA